MADTTLLISRPDFEPYKALSANMNTVKNLDAYILEAQEMDLKPLMGREIYIDLLDDFEASPSLAIYDDLFNGLSYTYLDKKYKHAGLVPVLCYFTYARFLLNANGHSTEFGIVKKKTEDSEAVSDSEIARRVSQARAGAMAYWEDVRIFLNHYKDTYTLWQSSADHGQLDSGLMKIIAIGDDN